MSATDPVVVRLTGPRAAVIARLADLEAVFTVTEVFGPLPTRSRRFSEVLVYTAFATIVRRFPVSGGGR